MEGMEYTPILTRIDSADSAIVSMLEDSKLSAQNLGEAAKLLGKASEQAVENAAQQKLITQTQKQAILWLNQNLKDLPEELVKTIKDTFASLSTKMTNLAPSVVQEATRTLVLPLIDKMIGGLNVDEIGRMAMAKVKQSLGLDNLNKYSAGYRAIFDQIYKEFGSMLKNSQELSNQFEKAKKTLANTVLTDFSATSGSQAVNKEIVTLLKQIADQTGGNVPTHYINNKDMSGSAQRVTRTVERMQRNAFSTQKEAENVILQYFDPKKLTQEGKNRAKQAAEYAANMQKAGYGVSFARDKGSQEIKVIVYDKNSVNAFDRTGKVNRQNAATASFAVGGLDKRNDDYVVDQAKRVKVSDAEAQKFVEMSQQAPKTIASARKRIGDIKNETVNKSTSKYDRQDNLYGVGADKALVESRTRFENEVKRLVAFEQKQGSTLSERELTELFTKMFISFAGHSERDVGVQSSLRELQTKKGLSDAAIREFNKNFSWLPQVGSMGEEDSGHYRLWGAKEMKDKMALVTRKIQGRDIQPYANQSKPERVQNIEVDINRLFEQVGNLLTSTDKKKREAAEVIDKNRDLIEGLVDGMALVSKDEIENLDTIREGVSVKIAKNDLRKYGLKGNKKSSAKLRREAYKKLLAAEGREATGDNVDLYVDPETGDVTLTGKELVRAHTGTKANSAYGNLRVVYREVAQEVIKAISTITGVGLTPDETRATVISAREETSSRNIGQLVTRAIDNAINELDKSQIEASVKQLDTSKLSDNIGQALIEVLLGKLSFSDALDKYVGSNVSARTKFTGETLYLLDELTGGKNGYEIVDGKLLTKSIASSFTDVVGTRYGEYAPRGAASLPTNWEIEDLERSARAAGVKITPENSDFLRTVQLIAFGATREDIENKKKALQEYNEHIERQTQLIGSQAGLNSDYINQNAGANTIVVGSKDMYGNQEHFININALRRTEKLDNGQSNPEQRGETIWGKLDEQLQSIDRTQAKILVDLGADMGKARYLDLGKYTDETGKYTDEIGDYNESLENLLDAVRTGKTASEKKELLAALLKAEAYNFENTGGAINEQFLAKMAHNQEEARKAAQTRYGKRLSYSAFYGENTNIVATEAENEVEAMRDRMKASGAYADKEHIRAGVAVGLNAYEGENYTENLAQYLQLFAEKGQADAIKTALKDRTFQNFAEMVDFATNILTTGTDEHTQFYAKGADGTAPILNRGFEAVLGRQPYSQAINLQYGGLVFGKEGLGTNVIESNRGLNKLIMGDFDGDKLYTALVQLRQAAQVMNADEKQVEWLDETLEKVKRYNEFLYEVIGANIPAIETSKEEESVILEFGKNQVLNEKQMAIVRSYQNQAKNKTGNWSNIAKGSRNVLELQEKGTGAVVGGDLDSTIDFLKGSFVFEALEQAEQNAISSKKLWEVAIQDMQDTLGSNLDQVDEETFTKQFAKSLDIAINKVVDEVYQNKANVNDVIQAGTEQGIYKSGKLETWRSQRILATLAAGNDVKAYEALEKSGIAKADLDEIAKTIDANRDWESFKNDQDQFKTLLYDALKSGAFNQFGFSVDTLKAFGSELDDDFLEKAKQAHGRFREETGPTGLGTAAGELIKAINKLTVTEEKVDKTGFDPKIVSILEEIRDLLAKQGRGGLNDRYGKTYMTPTGITASLNPYYGDESAAGYLQGKIIGFKDSKTSWDALSLEQKAKEFDYTDLDQFKEDRKSVVGTFIGTLAHAFSESETKKDPEILEEAKRAFKKNMSMLFDNQEVEKYFLIANEYAKRNYDVYNRLAGPDAYRAAEEKVRLKEDGFTVKGKTDAIYTSKRLAESGQEYQLFNIVDFKNEAKLGAKSIEQVLIYVEMYRRIKQELDDMIRSGVGEENAYKKMSEQTLLSEDTLRYLHGSLDVGGQIIQSYGGKTKVYNIADVPRNISQKLVEGMSLTAEEQKIVSNSATASSQLAQTMSPEFQKKYQEVTGETFGTEDFGTMSVNYEKKLAEERALKEQLDKTKGQYGDDSLVFKKLTEYYQDLVEEIKAFEKTREEKIKELALTSDMASEFTSSAQKEVAHSVEMGDLKFGYEKIIEDDEKQRLLAQKQREAALKQYKQYNDQIAKTEKDMLVLDKQINTSPSKLEKGLQADKGQIEILKAELRELVEKRNLLATNNQFTQAETAEMDAQLQKKRELNKLKVASMAKGAGNWLDVIGSGVKNTITRMFDYNGVYRILNRITQGLRQIVQQVTELDTAMFNLQVASGSNREEVSALINDYSRLAKQLHTTTTQIAASANEWLRQGYEAGQANELIKASTYLSKLGMIEAGQATTYLTSMIKGFKLEAADAVNVVDKLTAVDMEAAVSAGGIAAAMQNVATTAQLAGLSIDKTIGYLSTIIEVTQRDPSSVGMGMRTILARYGNVKAGAFTRMTGMENSDADLENINDIEKVLGKVGIRIRENAQEFRNFGDVIDELSLKWQKYDSVTKNAIATAMAGVRQRESFLVLMENKERADELEDVSATSKGTADTKYEAYQQTLSAAKADLQTALQDLAKSIHDSGLILRLTQLGTILTKMIVPGFNMLASALWARNSFKLSTQLQYSLEQRKSAIAVSQGLSARKIQEESQRREGWRRAFYEKKEGGTKTFVDKLLGNMPESFTEANKVVQEFTTNLGVAAKNVKNFPNGGGGAPTGADGSIKEATPTADENSSGSKFRPGDYTPYQKESTYQKGPLKGRTKLKYLINPPGLDKKKLQAAIDSGEITEEQAAKMKLDYKRDLRGDKEIRGQQVKENIPGAIGAGVTSALTTGFTQEGSAGAKAVSGITAGVLTGAGALAGPVGAAIGSTLGSILGPAFAKLVDKEETERKERAENAQKQLDALNSLNNTFEGIHEYTEKEYLTSEAILAIKESVDSIDEQMSMQELDFDVYLKQAADKMNLGKEFQTIEGIRELLTAADEKTRQKAQEVFDLAQSMAKVQTAKESKAASNLSKDENRVYWRSLDKEYIKQAYIVSGLEKMSLRELSNMNLEDAVKRVAEQFEKLGVTPSSFALYDSEGNVTEQAAKYITDQLRKSDRMQEMLNGSVLTLTEALQDKDKNANVIESFASALGVSTTRLEEMSDQLGALKLSDFVKSASQLREMLNDLYGILDNYYETGYLDLNAQEKILSNYPEYADLISDPGKIAESINKIVDGVKVLYVKNSLNEWAQNEKNAETYVGKFLEGYKGGDYKTLFTDKKYFGDLSTPEQMLQRIDMLIAAGDLNSDVLQAVKGNIERGMKNYESMAVALAEQLENTKKLESVNKYLDKSYEKQINALEEQKSALEQINSQREYENKLIEAKIKLENAQNEKKKVWREGVGWVYEADTSAIADAQKELEDLDNEKKVNELQAQIDELQAQRDYLGDIANKQELEGLKRVYEDWQKEIGVSNIGQAQALEYFEAAYTKIQNLNLNPNKTGSDGNLTEGYLENVTDQRTKNLGALKGVYNTLSSSNPDTTADYTTESIAAIDTYNDALKSFKDKHKAYIESGGSNTQAAKELGISEEELQQKLDSSELKLSPKRGAYFDAGLGGATYKTIYTTWQPNDTDDAGFMKATPSNTYVLLNNGYWANISSLFDVDKNSELREPKYSGLIFMEAEGKQQFFWNYKGEIYKASLREKDWGKESGVKDSTNLVVKGHEIDMDHALEREGFRNADGKLISSQQGYATGTLSAQGGLSLVNDDPQYGLEGIITPQGTLTALPSKSGVVPADMTRNVWQLGEVAPNLIKQLVDINGKFNSPLGFGTDESFNVDHLDVHMVAQPGFDMDDFVRQLRAARDLSKHS